MACARAQIIQQGGERDDVTYLLTDAGHTALVLADGCVSCQDQGLSRKSVVQDGRGDTPGMARTKPWHRTSAEQDTVMAIVSHLHDDVEGQRAAARLAIWVCLASIDPPDEQLPQRETLRGTLVSQSTPVTSRPRWPTTSSPSSRPGHRL